MARLRTVMITLLLLVMPLIGAQAQTPTQPPPPPQLEQAVSGLGSLLGVPLTVNDLDSWQASQDAYTDSALGCPYVYGQPIPEGISAYTFKLGYQGLIYDYRISVDGTIAFPCIRDGGGPLGDTPTPLPSATSTPRFQVVPIGSPVLIVGTPTPTPRLQIALPGHLGIITPTPNLVIHR